MPMFVFKPSNQTTLFRVRVPDPFLSQVDPIVGNFETDSGSNWPINGSGTSEPGSWTIWPGSFESALSWGRSYLSVFINQLSMKVWMLRHGQGHGPLSLPTIHTTECIEFIVKLVKKAHYIFRKSNNYSRVEVVITMRAQELISLQTTDGFILASGCDFCLQRHPLSPWVIVGFYGGSFSVPNCSLSQKRKIHSLN